MNKIQQALGIGALVLGLSGCGGDTAPQAMDATTPKPQSEIEKRLPGYHLLNTDKPVPYTCELTDRIVDYGTKHPAIGLSPLLEYGNLTGFGVYFKVDGGGYTGMECDILALAETPVATSNGNK